jgi:dihydropteroate synthase
MTRTRTDWKVRDHAVTMGERTLIMGVLNVTPDSFSDGGKYFDPDAAVARAMQLEQEGADILDIGAESTKPGSQRINAGEELRRLVPVLKRLKDRLSIPISVDTYKAEVAEKALEHGASIVNDISALTWEPDLVKPVVKYDAGLILNHMRGTPETWAKLGPMKDVMGGLIAELEAAVHRAVRANVSRERIVIDPGIGFGKRGEQNSEILARLGELQRLGLPILVAPSRKSFLGQEDARALEFATAAAVTAAILNGAAIVRVHDVAAMKPVVQTADAVFAAIPERVEKAKPLAKPRLDSEVQAERRKQPVRPVRAIDTQKPSAVEIPKPEKESPTVPTRESAPTEDRPRRPFERRSEERFEQRPERTAYQRPREDRKPEDRRDRPFQRKEDAGDRPERRPYQRSGPPPSQPGDRRQGKPFERRDRPFRPRDEEREDKPQRRPYQKADSTQQDRAGSRGTGGRPSSPGGRPTGGRPGGRPPSGGRPPAGKPFERRDRPFPPKDDRRGPGDRPRGAGDSRPGSKGSFGPKRGGSDFGAGRPQGGPRGPRDDKRGGGRPPGGGPKRPGGPPRGGGPRKRS